MKETISLHAMESIKIHDMKNTTKKVWAKPEVRKMSIKNLTLSGTTGSPTENPQSKNINATPS